MSVLDFVKYAIFASLVILSIMLIGFQQVFALQQVAGQIEVNIAKGESKTVEWGLVSDYPDKVTNVEISAEGEGAEFLSFQKSIQIQPQQIEYVQITVNIPEDYSGRSTLLPVVLATEYGQTGGPTVINIQMKKMISIVVSQPEQPTQKASTEETAPDSTPEVMPESTPEEVTEKPMTQSESPVCGEGTVLKDGLCVPATIATTAAKPQEGGGCLIATAAFGSELAPQVQLLREVRDNVLFNTNAGTSFMSGFNVLYYSFSPTVADWERNNLVFKEAVKTTITPMILTLSILNYIDIDSEQEMFGFGIGMMLLNVGMYFVIPALVIIRLKNHFL